MLSQRGDGDIGKSWVATLGNSGIRNLTGKPGHLRVQRQDAVCVAGQQAVQPSIKAICALYCACAAQLANALRHFCNSDARQVELLMVPQCEAFALPASQLRLKALAKLVW